jgi:hypothetical protein
MQSKSYRPDPKIVPPVVLAMTMGLLLIILEGATPRGILLIVLLSPFFYLGAEILARKIVLDDKGLEISKFLRTVRLDWADIRSLDAVSTGSKLFLILAHEKGRPSLITNTIRPFKDLTHSIMEKLPSYKVSEYAKQVLEDPPVQRGPFIQACIVCIVLTALVIGKLLGYSS